MGYSACCFNIDVNMFWIFILFCFFPCSHKQLCLIKKIFNLLYKRLIFIFLFPFTIHGGYAQSQTRPDSHHLAEIEGRLT